MADQLSLRGGTTAEHATFTGANKEVTVDTTKKTLVVNDGATVGGHPLMRENASNSALALGSAGTPSLKFTGDTNTGIYSPGADQLAVATNGTGRLFIGANPHVGIGITPNASSASSQVLEVGPSTFSSIGNDSYQGSNWFYTGAAYVYKNSAAATQYVQASGNHIWQTAAAGTAGNAISFSERLRITSAGLVGIGTSAPTNTAGFSQQVEIAGSLPCLTLNQNNASFTTRKYSLAVNSVGDFGIWDNTPAAYRFYINSSGNVGIGTTSPVRKLVISNSGAEGLETGPGESANLNLQLHYNRSSSAYVTNKIDAADHLFFISATEHARIDSSGRLLVGTSSTSADTRVVIAGTSSGYSGAGLNLANTGSSPADGVALGIINFTDSNHGDAAIIRASRDGGTWTSGSSRPTRLTFSTTADGAASSTERMRIKSTGTINFSNVATYADNAAATSGGLAVGDVYRTSTGQLMIRY